MDLFASYRNHQLSCWFSRTSHPRAVASNALSQSWTGLSLHPFPPIPLLEKTLIKIREDQVEEVIVIAPSKAKEILVPPSPPDDVRDPTPHRQTESPVTTLA